MLILSVALYRRETWSLTVMEERRLRVPAKDNIWTYETN
jgi:hypothetical protein